MRKIRVYPEVPMELNLKFVTGRLVKDNSAMMFSTVDGCALFVSLTEGQEIEGKLRALQIEPGQRVLLRRGIKYGASGRTVGWEVFRSGAVRIGQQTDGTFCVPRQPGVVR